MKYSAKEEWRKLQLISEVKCTYDSLLKGVPAEEVLVERTCETWQDLHDIIGVITHQKELAKIAKQGGTVGKAAETVISHIPGASAFLKWAQVPGKVFRKSKNIYSVVNSALDSLEGADDDSPDLEKAGGFLDAFKVDDGYQEMIDDKLEAKFFEKLSNYVAIKVRQNPDEKLPDQDINKFFEDWLSKEVGSKDETVVGGETSTKWNEIPAIEKPSEFKKSAQRVGKALTSTLGTFLGWKK